uniref:Laminin subunit alpha-5 n=1 Tax=Scophthalmus maximus TaxID=52904 RepID=A0A8D3CNT9_SCOMX
VCKMMPPGAALPAGPRAPAPRVALLLWPLLLATCCGAAAAQELPANGVNGYSLHPPYFNLAEGTKITASATCGEDDAGRTLQDLYCKLVGGPVSGDPSQTIQGQYCDICSQGESDRAHPITNAVDGTERWWQSPPLSRSTEFNEVNVTLDLGQLFHVAYVLIKFANSPRPDLWVLERSTDFGQTYLPWQFFASSKRDCIERFGQRTIERINSDDDVACTTEYSRIVPLENGEIVVSLVNGRPGSMNFSYSPVLREFTKATNIRLRFLRTNTLLGHLMGKALRDPTVTRRYYYSIKDISIGGRCVCNGHAEACNAKDPNDPYKLQCDCQHNTCGVSCDQCCPGHKQLPWKPATTYSANKCEPCNCHRHSFDCYYDHEVDQRRGSMDVHGHHRGGGVCLNCQHHTTGVNCERCIPTYYRSPDHAMDSPLACSPCDCRSEFTDGTCEDLTGRCFCKPNYTGENCDSCASGFINFPDCYRELQLQKHFKRCSAAGTVDNSCFTGDHCDTCAPGFYGLNCQACQCSGPGCLDGSCDLLTGHSVCRSGFQGFQCDQCAPGYFNYPLCQLCGCSSVGSLPEVCDLSGRCLCKPEFQGPRCEQCRSGFHSYPNCQVCTCDPRTSLDASCTASGHCHCQPNYSGATCDQCAPGYYGYPTCTPCQCSAEGSRYTSCDHVTGQCVCLPNVVGLRCDSCAHGAYGFPHCQAGTCHPAGSVHNVVQPPGQCECRHHVEGPACDTCKPLYWNLSPDTPDGCSNCECHTAGTLSGVAECAQETGQCHCKPNACSGTCSTCKDGYYNLQEHSYFGCQGCQCDIGGSAGQSCGERNGRCRCRPNVEGAKCNLPRPDHYFPDLHHLKFEIEEGTMLDGRPVRFGYDPLEFRDFSWRGYALMSVLVSVSVGSPDLFHVVLRYANRAGSDVRGRVSVIEDGWSYRCGNCSEQSKQIVFAPSAEPTFVNVPQNNFVEPFVLNPGTWTVVIEAEGILLDYLVLLPSAYYEAPILQIKVTEPCTYSFATDANQNCLLYRYLSLDSFPSISGNDASCRNDNHLPRPCPTERVTPRHPDMAVCSGYDISVELQGRLPARGDYALVVEYSSEEELPQTLSVVVNMPGSRTQQHSVTLLHCKYSFLCRVVAIDAQNRVAVFTLPADAEVQLVSDRASFFLHKVYLVPKDQFTMEHVAPKVHCISTHGQFSPDSSSCAPSRFRTPSDSLVLKDGQSSSTLEPILASPSGAPPLPLRQAVFSTRVHALGRYVFILHYHQPLHPTYPVQVYINGGRIWQGHANASFCPHASGCRNVLISENQIILDVTDHEVFITVQIPAGKTLWLDYVLVVPQASYSSSYLNEEPLDKSYDFISNCGQKSFYINPATASKFCLSSAVSLSAFFNNGALPCACHEVGAESDTCETFGGQCRCRPNVIGRDCSMCATGYWGFPNCRPCNCGSRLCEPVTGDCICPPRTLRPECTQCEPQTFGCHPLVGCEVCNCSRPGIVSLDVGCDTLSGQCRCKNNIVGRQCDRCAPGFYGFPNCRPCDCNEAGTEEEVCNSFTGQCLCKENVQGSRCDQCRVGTFHLDPTNPKGCTSCFCFGATDRCRSSDKRRTEIMNMEGWVLLGADRQEVPVTVYPGQDLVEADLSDVPDVYQDLHWHSPKTYLGDKVSSYGGYLRYRLTTQTMRGDVLSLPAEAHRPDIILKVLNTLSNTHTHTHPNPKPLCKDTHAHRRQINLGSFRHAQTGNSVSREELMMVLVGLESLQVRAIHSQSAHSVSLRGAVLEGAASLPAGRHANNVEICMCPANYLGDSCQKCAPGYYRDTIGLFLGKCVPCNCNGHSDQCLDGSGICSNCRHNTAGDHCEQCQGGFLGNNSVDGQAVSCSSCPCPLRVPSNNFAEGCLQKNERMQCLCMPGYAGPHCERCAPGFYGNPMVLGSRCQPCHCHDNTDPNMLFTDCHPLTGECLSCMHNTAGPHCDICAPGYHGDAVAAKNCTKCNCSPCGTDSCDPHTGQCRCKSGVTGPRCDRCEDGSFGFDSCSGCRHCDCEASAALVQPCDAQNGQCACQPGVNGPKCTQCAPGFWDYGPDGCKKCHCKGGRCDPRTGECRCPDGMTGKQCDVCTQKHNVIVEEHHGMHCEPCDSCVIVLLEDLDQMNNNFSSVAAQLGNLNASSMAWAQLQVLNKTVENLAVNILLTANRSSLNDTGAEHDYEERERKMREVQAMLREMRYRSCVGQKKLADKEKTEAEKLLDHVNKALAGRHGQNKDLAKAIRDRLARFHSEMMDLRDALNEAVNNTARAAEINNVNEKNLEDNKQKEVNDQLSMAEDAVAQVNDVLSTLHDSKEEYERLAAQLDGARTPLAKKVQDFAGAESKIPLVEEAEKHAELLDALAMNLTNLVAETKRDGIVDVTQAYHKIINSIKEAEEAANMADKAANATVEVRGHTFIPHTCLSSHACTHQDNSNNRTSLDYLSVMSVCVCPERKEPGPRSDHVSQEIDAAKQAADLANTTATQVNDALRPIREQLDQWEQTYGDANATNDDINKALMEANKTGRSLHELGTTIPTLLTKLDRLQNNSIQMPNISENINRIRQLIQQARNAASKVSVPVKFNGGSGVQVRTPANLADMAAYTSLKLYITLPEAARARRQGDGTQQFVFYLGNKDFLGMALEGKRLRWYFNVGGETAEVQMPEDVKANGYFNSVVLERTLQYGQMSMSSETEGDQRVTKAHVEAGGDQGLLNLLTNDTVFYVGGYPSTFKPPSQLALPNFKGCIELDTLNEEVLSLYNFERTFNLNTTEDTPCGRSVHTAWVNDAAYFDGTGYSEITLSDESTRMQRFEQEVKLLSQRGILLLLRNGVRTSLTRFCSLNVQLEIIILRQSPNRIVVRNNRVSLYTHQFTETIPPFGGYYYLGGVPQDKMPEKLKSLFPKQGSLKGCFRNVKAQNSHVDLKRTKSSGVSFGCDSDLLVAREAHFSGQSYLDLALTNVPSLRDNFYASFSFRTEKKEGLMFYHQDKEGVCQVFLHEGHVVVRAGNSEIRTQKTYNDANSHYVAIYSNTNGMRLYMDDMLEKAKEGIRLNSRVRGGPTSGGSTFLGGMPDQTNANLTGCISNSIFNRPPLSLSLSLSVSVCRPHISMSVRINSSDGLVLHAAGGQRGGAAMSLSVSGGHLLLLLDGGKRKVSLRSRKKYSDDQWHTVRWRSRSGHMTMILVSIKGLNVPGSGGFTGCVKDLTLNEVPAGSPAHSQGTVPCFLNPLQPGAYFSGQGGHISLVLGRDLEIQLEVRPVSDSGLLLHAGTSPDQHLSLVLSQGEVRTNSGKGEFSASFTPEEPLCNGRWHTITVVKKNNVLQLHVDAGSEHSVGPKQSRSAGAKETVYLGGVPDGITVPGLPAALPAFHGCIRQATVNHRPAMLSKPLAVHGAVGTQGCPHM